MKRRPILVAIGIAVLLIAGAASRTIDVIELPQNLGKIWSYAAPVVDWLSRHAALVEIIGIVAIVVLLAYGLNLPQHIGGWWISVREPANAPSRSRAIDDSAVETPRDKRLRMRKEIQLLAEQNRKATLEVAPQRLPGQIEICFEKRAPYEVVEALHGHVKSTVRIGIKNPVGRPVTNCKVYIDRISPEPPLPGGLPILLESSGFTLRDDEAAKLIDIAVHWDHVHQFRFSSPAVAHFAEQLLYLDEKIARTFELRIEASEVQRRATFRIFTDDMHRLRLDFIGYIG